MGYIKKDVFTEKKKIEVKEVIFPKEINFEAKIT